MLYCARGSSSELKCSFSGIIAASIMGKLALNLRLSWILCPLTDWFNPSASIVKKRMRLPYLSWWQASVRGRCLVY